MGDFAVSDLIRANGLYPHHAGKPCSGCGGALAPDDRAYADYRDIWHSDCFPVRDGSRPFPRHLRKAAS